MQKIYTVALCIFSMLFVGCSKDDDPLIFLPSKATSLGVDQLQLQQQLADDDLVLLKDVTINGDTGYLYKFTKDGKDLTDKNGNPKRCLVLSGAPHSLGYQAAYLLPGNADTEDGNQGTYEMLSAFIKKIGLEQFSTFGLNVPYGTPEGEAAWEKLFSLMDIYGKFAQQYIPDYMQQEMQGIVDGLHAYADDNLQRDPELAKFKEIGFRHVLALNQGVDSTYYLLAALLHKVPTDGWDEPQTSHKLATSLFIDIIGISLGLGQDEAALKLGELKFDQQKLMENFRAGCNELAVTGAATRRGETFHGRDFMFGTADIYQDASVVMVYLPDDEGSLPFITTDAPGFVGHASGLNSQGLSVGVDISQAGGYGKDPGVGCLLINRAMLQKAANIDQAIQVTKAITRGVPWIYFVADDDSPQYGNSAVLECARSDHMDGGRAFRGYETLDELRQQRFAYAISQLPPSDIPDDGIVVRSAKWQYPAGLEHLPTIDPESWGDHPSWDFDLLPYFPRQTEAWDDVCVATNHFITPEMRFSQLYWAVQLLYGIGPLQESMWRYDFACKIIKETYGDITFWSDPDDLRPGYGSAGWLIDYLNPNWENSEGVKINSWFYCSEDPSAEDLINAQVQGHHAVFNNSSGEMKALFGYMQDPWVGLNIKELTSTP